MALFFILNRENRLSARIFQVASSSELVCQNFAFKDLEILLGKSAAINDPIMVMRRPLSL